MGSLPREAIIIQLPQMEGRISDEKVFKFLTSFYNLYSSFHEYRFDLNSLTALERQCLSDYSAPSLINVYRRLRSRRNLQFFKHIPFEREILSALVFLRLNFVPLCYQINEDPWHPLLKWIEKSMEVEQVMKSVIHHHYATGVYQDSLISEGPNNHSWWSKRIMND
ncbi:hypothetical protein PMAYCL1PPCAC_12276, partial [Pristionchus mayeri]